MENSIASEMRTLCIIGGRKAKAGFGAIFQGGSKFPREEHLVRTSTSHPEITAAGEKFYGSIGKIAVLGLNCLFYC